MQPGAVAKQQVAERYFPTLRYSWSLIVTAQLLNVNRLHSSIGQNIKRFKLHANWQIWLWWPLIICGVFIHVWSHHCNLSMPAVKPVKCTGRLLRNTCYIMLSWAELLNDTLLASKQLHEPSHPVSGCSPAHNSQLHINTSVHYWRTCKNS